MAPGEDPDGLLIRTLQGTQDQRLFGKLIEKYRDFVYNFCFRFLGNEEDAADCSQEVFIRIFQSVGSFCFKSRFSTWLYRLTLNTCIEMARSKKRRGIRLPLEEIAAPFGDSPAGLLERKEVNEAFHSALERLNLIQRSMVIMRDLEGLTYEEISTVTGKKPGTVRSTLARARLRIAYKLKEYHDET
ncbi:MAG: RNA polymerase sigma factor [Bacteroidota bacterium]